MAFQEQIKALRKELQLSQEEFAQSLYVSRQAVSNWETGKNLPDIETLIRLCKTYHLSLDALLFADEKDGLSMQEKLIQDGSDVQKSKYQFYQSLIGGFLLLIGLILFFVKSMSVVYVDEAGVLHENFFLIPLGYLFLLAGIVVLTISLRRKKRS